MNGTVKAQVDGLIDDCLPRRVSLRHDLHAYPELRYEEVRTSDVVAEELRQIGYEVKRGLGGTGVVATLPGLDPSRAILLRADLDALPIKEASNREYASRYEGRMHACGHDGHTVMILGAARVLKQLPQLPGTVHFVFLPAEEGGAGGEAGIHNPGYDFNDELIPAGVRYWTALALAYFQRPAKPF